MFVVGDSALTVADLTFVQQFITAECGIVLDTTKKYLVETRLYDLARRLNTTSTEVIRRLRSPSEKVLRNEVVDALTTHETSFFRDQSVFDALRTDLLPKLVAANAASKSIRIWSAACSTGQEVFSICMLLNEHFRGLPGWKVELLATDISTQVVAKAQQGVFSQLEVNRGLPVQFLVKYFKQNGREWQLKDEIRTMPRFQVLNLLSNLKSMGKFDLILCRNVLIYFEQPLKKQILEQLRGGLNPNGALFLGSAETVYNVCEGFSRAQSGKAVYYQAG